VINDTRDSGDFVQSLSRGLSIIRTFDAEHPRLSLSEVARRADIPPAAARRFLLTLETLGYVRSDARQFELTARVLELGFSYLSALSLPETMQPHLERLSRAVNESVSAAVLSDTEIVYVARVVTRRIMSVRITIGTRFPAYATSMGRVLLAPLTADELAEALWASHPQALTDRTMTDSRDLTAELARVGEQGWALVDGELEEGLRSIAAPIHGRDRTVAAAINISMSASGESLKHIREHHVPLLLETARAIENDLKLLGGRGLTA
jgi:IclR family pca regulon transcriptional regulator